MNITKEAEKAADAAIATMRTMTLEDVLAEMVIAAIDARRDHGFAFELTAKTNAALLRRAGFIVAGK